nr:integrase, catalytic region, zinc finger, CCHC-type, peptidase aspartic, catalytic [Tanacetum cinerariifolium]
MTGDRSQLTNFVIKFLGTDKFGNDHVAKIMGFGDYKIENVTISRVYFVGGLGHNLFSAGQFSQKAAKRRKLNEEVEDLKRHLEIVPDEDDDVYTKATPLARKVPIVDYEIIHLNNKPHYKIIQADGTHQLWTGSSLEESKDYTWQSKGQELEATGIVCFGVDVSMDIEEKHSVFNVASEKLSAAKQKLMLLDSAAEGRLILPSQVKTVNNKCCC